MAIKRRSKDIMPEDPAPIVLDLEDEIVEPVRAEPADELAEECPPLIDGKPTVNGRPLTPDQEMQLPYRYTDQGIWHHNQGKPKPQYRLEVGDGPWEKALQQRADMPWMGSDPFKEAVDRHRKPGMNYRLLSDNVCSRRGMRGWEPIKNSNGDLVKVNTMFLAAMPSQLAHQRNEHYRKRGNEALEHAQEQLVLEQEKTIRDAGGQGMAPLRRGDVLHDHRDPGSEGLPIGFEQVRGRATA